MRQLIAVTVSIVMLHAHLVGEAWSQQSDPAPEGSAVSIASFAFQPATISVPVGGIVVWTNNQGVPHTATSTAQDWDAGTLTQGQSGSVTFSTAGSFTYSCMIHTTMQGVVQV